MELTNLAQLAAIRPVLAVAVSLIAASLILCLHNRANIRDAVSVMASIIKFGIVISMAPLILAGNTINLTLFEILPGIDFAFRVDSLGMVFATVSSLLWIFAAIYSIGYMRSQNEKNQTRFYASFAVSLSAAVGGAFAANLFTLVIFYEILSLITYPLVYHKENSASWNGSKRYIVYLVGASKSFLLAALALTYQLAGNLDFMPQGLFNNLDASHNILIIVYFCYLFGFAKAAIMPFHAWLPAAMVAPTPVSALLHAVAVVKMGVFCLLRVIFHVFGIELMSTLGLGIITAYLVSFTIITASIYALTRDDLKARLAYSTVSQLSYIILGAVILTPMAAMGGIMHIAAHAFSKITLFFCAGSIYCASQRKKISDLSGIGKRLPLTMAAFFIGSLGMIGIPPTGGFISKWYLVVGSVNAEQIALLTVLMVSAVLNAAYFLPITYKAFFESEKKLHDPSLREINNIRETPMIALPLLFTAVFSLILGLYPEYFLDLAKLLITDSFTVEKLPEGEMMLAGETVSIVTEGKIP